MLRKLILAALIPAAVIAGTATGASAADIDPVVRAPAAGTAAAQDGGSLVLILDVEAA